MAAGHEKGLLQLILQEQRVMKKTWDLPKKGSAIMEGHYKRLIILFATVFVVGGRYVQLVCYHLSQSQTTTGVVDVKHKYKGIDSTKVIGYLVKRK